MNDLLNKIKEITFKQFNDEIKEENLESFFNSLSEDELIKIVKVKSVISSTDTLKGKTLDKNKIVNYILNNYKKIYSLLLEILDEDFYLQMKKYIKENNNGYLKMVYDSRDYSISFLLNIYNFRIGKVKYDNKTNILEIYIPKETIETINLILKDKSIRKKINENTKIMSNINGLMVAYGIVTIDRLHEIYEDVFSKISNDKLLTVILFDHLTNQTFDIIEYKDSYLINGLSCEEEDAIKYYESIDKKLEYKIFSKEELEDLDDGLYHHQSINYDSLLDEIRRVFNFDEYEIEDFDEEFIVDYMFSFSEDEALAKKNINSNLTKNYPDLDFVNKSIIMKKINSVAKDYPIFKYKGYSINEMKSKQ